ncbi:MAG: MarR family transcriptional regulator [Myxococcota bacterium]
MADDFVDRCLAQWSKADDRWDAKSLSVVMRIMRLASLFEARLDAVARAHKLSVSDYDVLASLRRQPTASLLPKELCKETLLTSGTMTHRIDRLESRGYVKRRADPTDRRAVRVGLTARGRALIDKITPQRAEDADAIAALLPSTRRRQLDEALRQLLAALDNIEEQT